MSDFWVLLEDYDCHILVATDNTFTIHVSNLINAEFRHVTIHNECLKCPPETVRAQDTYNPGLSHPFKDITAIANG